MPERSHRPRRRGCVWIALIVSCRLGGTDPESIQPQTAERDPATASVPAADRRPAFVVYFPNASMVVPLDAGADVVMLPGYFVVALPDEPARAYGRIEHNIVAEFVTPRAGPAALTVPVCPDEGFAGTCGRMEIDDVMQLPMRVTVDVGGATSVTPLRADEPCTCVAVEKLSTDFVEDPIDLDDPDLLAEAELSPYSLEEYVELCLDGTFEAELGPSSVLAGVLYETGVVDNASCSGANILNAVGRAMRLRPGAVPELTQPSTAMRCDPESVLDALGPVPEHTVGVEGCSWGAENCSQCSAVGEMAAHTIVGGRLIHALANIAPTGPGCLCVASVPVSARTCPSPHDPCGDPSPFVGLAGSGRWWVANDGLAALLLDGDELIVKRPGQAEAVRTVKARGEILGVEYHSDTPLLDLGVIPQSIEIALGKLDPPDGDADDTVRQWGNRCYRLLGAQRLEAARAACYQGLLLGGTDRTRAAITYNLGRIEEHEGNRERALAFYRRSLGLRSDNEVVQERVKTLQAAD